MKYPADHANSVHQEARNYIWHQLENL